MTDRMPVILGNKDSINAWLNNASVKIEEITVPYEGADLVSPCYALCYQYRDVFSRCHILSKEQYLSTKFQFNGVTLKLVLLSCES